MGYIVFKNSREEDEELNRDSEIESIVGEDAKALVEEMKLTPTQKKTIIEWAIYLGKTLFVAVLKKLITVFA